MEPNPQKTGAVPTAWLKGPKPWATTKHRVQLKVAAKENKNCLIIAWGQHRSLVAHWHLVAGVHSYNPSGGKHSATFVFEL